ncbi:YbbR domain-containing protein [Psychrobacillus sp. OK028]|uniref:CdaR family protein n=1 Tax=Psychrobacillus sp. OK028 TaxID=1884359 RepID=UPI0008835086|nr:CdaR family protein [Psychrobacillus sp. OK028]SDN50485.1 YbbR domain-containing protein [Psychrobacillus sp. OK028]
MDKMMNNPWFLRITALILAIALFISVKSEMESDNTNASNNNVDVIRDIPLEVYYDDDNLVVSGPPKTVNVNVEGPSQLVASAKLMKDFKVFVDLRELTIGTHRVPISTENFMEKLNVRTDPQFVDVVIEERISREFNVETDMNESLLAENYVVKSYEVKPQKVTITGAKSVINSIGYVKATISGDQGINKSFEQETTVKVLDLDLNKLDVIVEPSSVQVSVKVEEYSKVVPIALVKQGNPKEGITVNGLTTKTETIRLYGPKPVLDKIQQLNVDVDISKIEKSGSFDLKLAVPEGVTKLSKETIEITGDVTIAPDPDAVETEEQEDTVSTIIEKSFEQVAITVRGLPENLVSNFVKPANGTISVVAKGTAEALEKVQLNNFSIYVEATKSEVGESILPIQVEGSSDIEWVTSEKEAVLTVKEA